MPLFKCTQYSNHWLFSFNFVHMLLFDFTHVHIYLTCASSNKTYAERHPKLTFASEILTGFGFSWNFGAGDFLSLSSSLHPNKWTFSHEDSLITYFTCSSYMRHKSVLASLLASLSLSRVTWMPLLLASHILYFVWQSFRFLAVCLDVNASVTFRVPTNRLYGSYSHCSIIFNNPDTHVPHCSNSPDRDTNSKWQTKAKYQRFCWVEQYISLMEHWNFIYYYFICSDLLIYLTISSSMAEKRLRLNFDVLHTIIWHYYFVLIYLPLSLSLSLALRFCFLSFSYTFRLQYNVRLVRLSLFRQLPCNC